MRFAGKVAIITGAGSGIGRSTATRIAREGACVVIADIDEEKGKSAANEICSAGGQAISFKVDISSSEQVNMVAASTIERFGQIDILVNNAAIHGRAADVAFLDSDDKFIDLLLGVNVKGTILFSQAALRHMVKRKYGKIVNIASGSGLVATDTGIIYGTSKGAVISLSRNLARKFAPDGININCICPGLVLTEYQMFIPQQRPDFYKKLMEDIPRGKAGTPEDIAAMVLFLASDEAQHVVGQTISVSGGSHRN